MSAADKIFLGIDSGATTCKVNGVDASGNPLSNQLRQYPTRSNEGKAALIEGWLQAVEAFLKELGADWKSVSGVGLAMPGPFLKYGVLGKLINYPEFFQGWHYLDDLSAELNNVAGSDIPLVTANDGHLAGLAEAREIQQKQSGSVFLLAPGSGLGSAFIDTEGKMLEGDHLSGAFFCCMPLPYAELGLPKISSCKCGRNWGCAETYTALSGLPQLIQAVLPRHPSHAFHQSETSARHQALSLRGLAQQDDPLALEVFDFQAKAIGYVVAMASMAYDPSHIVIGGGLMDPESTTIDFRERFINQVRKTASRYLYIQSEHLHFHQARLGELSQSIGAALRARMSANSSALEN